MLLLPSTKSLAICATVSRRVSEKGYDGWMARTHYPSDLRDEEWMIIKPLMPAQRPGGRPRKWNMRDILDGIFYIVRGGCAWRM